MRKYKAIYCLLACVAVSPFAGNVFFYGIVQDDVTRSKAISILPSSWQSVYVNYILDNENGGFFRSGIIKCKMIKLIFWGNSAGIHVNYDKKLLVGYTDYTVSKRFNNQCLEEPALAFARELERM